MFRILLLLACAATCPAADIYGKWERNLDRSKYPEWRKVEGRSIITYSKVGDEEVADIYFRETNGQETNWTYKASYDGVRRRVINSNLGDEVSVTGKSDGESVVIWFRNGKNVRTTRRNVSKDGKTLTLSVDGFDDQGRPYHEIVVMERVLN